HLFDVQPPATAAPHGQRSPRLTGSSGRTLTPPLELEHQQHQQQSIAHPALAPAHLWHIPAAAHALARPPGQRNRSENLESAPAYPMNAQSERCARDQALAKLPFPHQWPKGVPVGPPLSTSASSVVKAPLPHRPSCRRQRLQRLHSLPAPKLASAGAGAQCHPSDGPPDHQAALKSGPARNPDPATV